MNSAAKALHHGFTLSKIHSFSITNTPYQWALQISIFALVISALLLVMLANQQRNLAHQLQVAQKTQDELVIEYSQLTLEKSTLLTQARIEQQAYQSYHMVKPKQRKLFVLH